MRMPPFEEFEWRPREWIPGKAAFAKPSAVAALSTLFFLLSVRRDFKFDWERNIFEGLGTAVHYITTSAPQFIPYWQINVQSLLKVSKR